MKALVAGVALVAAAFAILYAYELRTNTMLAGTNAKLSARLADKSGKDGEAAKVSCSGKAAEVFHSLGYSDDDNGNSGRLPSYTNHYSQKLGRCLMMVEIDNTRTGAVSKQIFDADERTPFGDYFWIPSATKKYWEQAPIECHMTPPDRDDAFCRSTDEWDGYAKSLMS